MFKRLRSDEGTTLVEVTTVAFLLGVVIPIFLAVLSSAQNGVERDISRTTSNDQIRLAVQSLDREIRSGNVVYDPGQELYSPGDVAKWESLRVYTQANAPTRAVSGNPVDSGFRCVQWRITSPTSSMPDELQRRSWTPGTAPTSEGWRTIASGIRNRRDPSNPVKAFQQNAEGNLIDINLLANEDPNARKGSDVEMKASVSGRNTILNWTKEKCGPPVPDPSLAGAGGNRVPGPTNY